MGGRSFSFLLRGGEKEYVTTFDLSDAGPDDAIRDCMLGNEDFLEEDAVVAGLCELTSITRDKIASLLRGEAHISQIPELRHTSVINEDERHTVDDYYYYSLQNGYLTLFQNLLRVVIFGLAATHPVIRSLEETPSLEGIEVVFDENLSCNIVTQSRAKRRRNKRFKPSHICEIKAGTQAFSVTVPDELSTLEVIETNARLLEEPKLLLSREGWLVIFLDKDKTMLRRKASRITKRS